MYGLLIFAIIAVGVFSIPSLRREVLTKFIFKAVKKIAPRISPIEQQAIDAGSEGFDRELFSGKPRWDVFRALPTVALTDEEEKFLEGPTKEFCAHINDWRVRGEEKSVYDEIWDFAKKHGFLGLRVSKEAGGHGFSAQAQSIILGMVASRSLDASTTVEVPNSLGPDELIEAYGTSEQKKRYLKKFVTGEEIACFAITSQNAGSDAASMRDVGFIQYGLHEGKKVLGVIVSWNKRYITLAPRATVIVLAFHLLDPENHLNRGHDLGITLALIPTAHQGVIIGRRHMPGGSVFPNGPTQGERVFIPLSWILGAEEGIGHGWKMVMQCLAAGRGISLPSMSTATVKMMLLVSTAYARIRRQFNKSIGKIEGIEEPLARIVEAAYVTEAGRSFTASMVTRENRPLVIASIMKYQTTEYARRAINDALDIHGGKGIIDGPSNYLQSAYQIAPVAITVEGANIITRSLIVIGQAILRSHPFFKQILDSLTAVDNEREALRRFDSAFFGQITFFVSNTYRSIFHNLTHGMFARSSAGPQPTRKWYKKLSHASARFAFLADFIVITYQGSLKKRQRIGARLTDALSELYLMACVLKRFEDDGALSEDIPIIELCLQNGLNRFENSLFSLIENLHSPILRWTARVVVFPNPLSKKPASDILAHKVVTLALEPGAVRDRLTKYVYVPQSTKEPVGLLEFAMKKIIDCETALVKIEKSIRSGAVQRHLENDWIEDAYKKGIVTREESEKVREADELVQKVSAVDSFDPKYVTGIRHDG